MEKTDFSFKERYVFAALALLLALLIIASLMLVERSENRLFGENQRLSIVEQLSTIRARLEGELNTELMLARSIVTDVATNKDITEARFFQIAGNFMAASRHIRNIGLAKGTVLTYVYPVKGNEKAIGLDYTKVASQWPAVLRVIESGHTVVAGPLNLVQGGVGIIGRTPIFIHPNVAGADAGEETYFGLLSVVIDLPSLLGSAGLDLKNEKLAIAMRGKDGLGMSGELFYGHERIFDSNPVLMEVTLPGGSWMMASVPVGGWQTDSPKIIYYRLVAVIVGLVILVLLAVQYREMIGRRRVEEERKKLIRDLREALSRVKQLGGLLPICANCKKIRDDNGYWKQIEAYIRDHSEADFSHGICPDCAAKLYPDLDLADDRSRSGR